MAGYDPDCGKGLPVSPVLIAAVLVMIAATAVAAFWIIKKKKQ
jgi:hypothetical protein